MRFSISVAVILLAGVTAAASDAPAPFAGSFSDGHLVVALTAKDDGYVGSVSINGKIYPATARLQGKAISGSFLDGANRFSFTATTDGQNMTLVSDGTTYVMKREAVSAGLAASAPDTTPAGYSLVNRTPDGFLVNADKPGVDKVPAAIAQAFGDLEHFFDARPDVGRAYLDTKDQRAGEAAFRAVLKGQPIKGTVSCRLTEAGASIAVLCCRADATPAQCKAVSTPTVPGAAPEIPLRTFEFPDGTGSVGLADGWSSQSTTTTGPVMLSGPAKQHVIIGNRILIQTPDSPMVQMMRRDAEMMRRAGIKNPPPPMLIAPYLEPVEALKTIFPQFSANSVAHNGPSMKLEKIISVTDGPTMAGGSKTNVIAYTYTVTTDGKDELMRSASCLTTQKMNETSWVWWANNLSAPDATFKDDAPAMFAMFNSLKLHLERFQEVSNEQSRQQMAIIKKMGDDAAASQQRQHENFMRAQADQFARHNEQFKADQLRKSRHNADVCEQILRTRDVIDTRTGERASVDISNVDAVVNDLNTQDPGRYKEFPLRDQLYPK